MGDSVVNLPAKSTQNIDAFSRTRALVLGAGKSGHAAAVALHDAGAHVLVLDSRPEIHSEFPNGVQVTPSKNMETLVSAAEQFGPHYVVASPGLAPSFELIQWAHAQGLLIMSEVELAWRMAHRSTDWYMITGTNGKTTTTGMVAKILAAAGLYAPAVGNIGDPIALAVLGGRSSGRNLDALAVEVSSFQLHFTHTVSPRSAVCLNIADDHLDWHGGREQYWAAKARVYHQVQQACVYPIADPKIEHLVAEADVVEGARAIGYSLGTPAVGQMGIVEESMVDRAFIPNRRSHGQVVAELSDLNHLAEGTLPPHLVVDALAAAALTRVKVAPSAVSEGLRAYELAEHRMQPVAEVNQVRYVNDSKATNAHAAGEALRGFARGQVVWIAGGLTKGADVSELVRSYGDRLRAAVIIGVDQRDFVEALRRHAPQIQVVAVNASEDDIMATAVNQATHLARPGDTVLLSPACASMDQFENFEVRGHEFIKAVQELS